MIKRDQKKREREREKVIHVVIIVVRVLNMLSRFRCQVSK